MYIKSFFRMLFVYQNDYQNSYQVSDSDGVGDNKWFPLNFEIMSPSDWMII